jgi:hypothetical protein
MPLLQLPASTGAALLLRGDAQPSVPGPGESVAQLFGGRLSAQQTKLLVETVDAFARSHHGATVVGFVPAPVPALLITCELTPGSEFPDAFANVLSLLQLPPVTGLLAGTWGKPSLELAKAANGVRHARLRLRPTGRGPSLPLPSALSLSWEAKDGVGYIVVSPDDAAGLAPFAATARLASSEWLARSQPGLAERRALAIFADARLIAPGGPDEAKVLLSFGKKADQIVLAIDAAAAALPALSRLFALDRSP